MPVKSWREECGVFGVFGHDEASYLTYLGIYALQHRGQESAGVVSTDGESIFAIKEEGLVAEVFNDQALKTLKGDRAIGHVRYSTSGKDDLNNVQPLLARVGDEWVAIAHNGNLIDADLQKKQLEESGAIFQSSSDTEIILHYIARSKATRIEEKLIEALSQVKGAYSLVLLTPTSLIAARDPFGFRPLVLGRKDDAFVISSETCALDLAEASYQREVEPGEIIVMNKKGGAVEMRSLSPWKNKVQPTPCVFEHVYFSRPDSIVFGNSVSAVRNELGKALAKEHAVEADLVVPVPDSGVPAAVGYSQESGIALDMAILRNHYVGRTFIQPHPLIRDFGVRLKLSPIKSSIKGKRLVVIDDSLVRGTTARQIVSMLRQAGAASIHFRLSSPPIQFPCVYGIDTPTKEELIGSSQTVEQICKTIGADSLQYLSQEAMLEIAGGGEQRPFCTACFDGSYAI